MIDDEFRARGSCLVQLAIDIAMYSIYKQLIYFIIEESIIPRTRRHG